MNLDDILWEALRWWIASNSVVDIARIHRLYEDKQYMAIIEFCNTINIDVWSEELWVFFLKSFIHLYWEQHDIMKDLILIVLIGFQKIEFSGLWVFQLDIHLESWQTIIKYWAQIPIEDPSWKDAIVIISWDFKYIFENVERLKRTFHIENVERDSICLFILSCFELYDLRSPAYPLFKWLFNLHFKSLHS